MPVPNEDAFVSARASLRSCEYLKLKDWFIAGGGVLHFGPWFHELLMDVDSNAFAVACSAIAAHYNSAACRHGVAVRWTSWLPSLVERLQRHGVGGPERAAAAELIAAALPSRHCAG